MAAKVINLRTAKPEYKEKFLPRELSLVKRINHPNIIKVYETIVHTPLVCIVAEYATNGTLLKLIKSKGRIPEPEAKFFFRQLIEAAHYLHRREIAHRDIKCENILLDRFGNLKLADFGFIRHMPKGEMSTTYCGSTAYTAPEILTGTPYYGCTCDIWSLGVVLYITVTGLMPFDEQNPPRMIKKQMSHQITYHKSVKDSVSKEAKQLIEMMLDPRPGRRATYEEIINSEWLKDVVWTMKSSEGICRIVETERLPQTDKAVGPTDNKARNTTTLLNNQRDHP